MSRGNRKRALRGLKFERLKGLLMYLLEPPER